MKQLYKIVLLLLSICAYAEDDVLVVNGIALQADGKILLTGNRLLNNFREFATTRLLANGAIDTSYGTNGTFYASAPFRPESGATCIAVQSDGKAIVAGYYFQGGPGNVIMRYTTAGALDTTYLGNGIVEFIDEQASCIQAILIQPSDQYLVYVGAELLPSGLVQGLIGRFVAAGGYDPGYNGGTVSLLFGQYNQANAVALDASGNILVSGYCYINGQQQTFIARTNSAGSISFMINNAVGTVSQLFGIIAQADTKILVCGESDNRVLLMRFNSNGTLDSSFGTGGIVTQAIGIRSRAKALVNQTDGKTVIAGISDDNLLVARFTTTGALDTTYNGIGYTLVPLGNQSMANALAIQPNDFTIAAGQFDNSSIATRIDTTGVVDATFDQGGIGSHPAGATSPTLFGNCVRVDKIYGNDAMGSRNGAPFLTINAALLAAKPGDTCWIFPGTYNESFTIPAGVYVKGFSDRSVTIQRTGVTTATDLVTMSNNTKLENVSLNLTSALHVQLRAVMFGGTTTLNASIENSFISVDNSGAGAGTSNIYGIFSNGTGTPTDGVINIRDCRISAASVNNGDTRGIYVGTANELNVRDTEISVTGSGGTGSFVGVETENASAICALTGCIIQSSGQALAQTLGQIFCTSTNLVNLNAVSGTSLRSRIASPSMVYAPYAITSGNNYITQGNGFLNGTNIWSIGVTQSMVAKSLAYRATSAGVGGVFTVRKNGSNTALGITLAAGVTSIIVDNLGVTFAAGDTISMAYSSGGTSVPANPVISLELY